MADVRLVPADFAHIIERRRAYMIRGLAPYPLASLAVLLLTRHLSGAPRCRSLVEDGGRHFPADAALERRRRGVS